MVNTSYNIIICYKYCTLENIAGIDLFEMLIDKIHPVTFHITIQGLYKLQSRVGWMGGP